MEPEPRPPLVRYGISIAVTLAALSFTILLVPVREQTPALLFIGAVLASVWYGGAGPGFVSATLGAVLIDLFVVPPLWSFELSYPTVARYVILATTGFLLHRLIDARTRAERAERAQRHQLFVTLGSIGDAVIAVGTDRRVTYMNSAAEALTGWASAGARGVDLDRVFNVVDAFTREPVESPAAKALRDGAATDLVGLVLLGAGDDAGRPVESRGAPIRDDNGNLLGSVVVFRDVSDRVKVEREREEHLAEQEVLLARAESATVRLHVLQDVVETALAHLSLDGLIVELHEKIRRVLRVDTAVILLREGDELVATAAKGLEEEVEQGVRIPIGRGFAGRVAAERRTIIVADLDQADIVNPLLGEKGIRSLLGAPLVIEGAVIGVLHVGTLTPAHFTDEDALLLQLIADRVALAISQARLYEAEHRARTEAETANRAKDEFLATLSHELRTPLNAMLGWVRLMSSGRLDTTSYARALQIIERNTVAQAQLIADILDVSRIITGKMHLEMQPVDLASVIEASVESARPAAEAKEIRIDVSVNFGAGFVRGAPERLQQVVWNLLSNAIKFTPRGGRVEVALRRAGSNIEVRVSDNGVGMATELLPYVFDRFRQADSSTTRQHGGLGLGLAIVRHLVEMHGGTVTAESEGEGRGATFTIRLPIAPTREINPAREPASRARADAIISGRALEGVRVLVVDDEDDARDLVALLLTQCGARVTTASSVAEAVAALDRSVPDVLVTDVGMPGQDGYALVRELRARGEAIPALALTAYARSEDRTRLLAAGFQSHLAKPAEPAELVAVIASLVENRVR